MQYKLRKQELSIKTEKARVLHNKMQAKKNNGQMADCTAMI
jgi:hypothetical protein